MQSPRMLARPSPFCICCRWSGDVNGRWCDRMGSRKSEQLKMIQSSGNDQSFLRNSSKTHQNSSKFLWILQKYFRYILQTLLTVYGGGISPSPKLFSSTSRSKLSWLVAIDGSELAFTSCGKLPIDNELDGPVLISRSDSGLDAYDKRDVVIGNKKSSDRDSSGYWVRLSYMDELCVILLRVIWNDFDMEAIYIAKTHISAK